ncbi:MAG: hypothetical protein WCV68_03945 [Candidatus Paceibacterota bacterium]
MSNLKASDRTVLEKLFNMKLGYVLNFTDRTMEQFFKDEFKISVYDTKYDSDLSSKSKANRVRGIWREEADTTVGGIILALTEQAENDLLASDKEISLAEKELIKKAREIGTRLLFPDFLETLQQQPEVQKLKLKTELIKNFNLSKIDDLPSNEKIYLLKVFYSYYENILRAYYGSGLFFPTSGIDDLNDYYKILRNKMIKIIESDNTFSEIKDGKEYQALVISINSLYICPDFFDGVWEDCVMPQIISLREEIADKDLFENSSEIHKTKMATVLFLEAIAQEIEKLNRFQRQQEKSFCRTETPENKEQTVKHEHTHRFENSIQEKDIVINHKHEDGDKDMLYITKKGDSFCYKGTYLSVSTTAEYYQVFCALFARLPEGGEITYKELSEEIKSRIPKTKSKDDEEMRKFIQSNLTDTSNGFVRYARIPLREDNGRPLIEITRGLGVRFNNRRG